MLYVGKGADMVPWKLSEIQGAPSSVISWMFPKMGYPQIIQNWTILVLKPMGSTFLRNHHISQSMCGRLHCRMTTGQYWIPTGGMVNTKWPLHLYQGICFWPDLLVVKMSPCLMCSLLNPQILWVNHGQKRSPAVSPSIRVAIHTCIALQSFAPPQGIHPIAPEVRIRDHHYEGATRFLISVILLVRRHGINDLRADLKVREIILKTKKHQKHIADFIKFHWTLEAIWDPTACSKAPKLRPKHSL